MVLLEGALQVCSPCHSSPGPCWRWQGSGSGFSLPRAWSGESVAGHRQALVIGKAIFSPFWSVIGQKCPVLNGILKDPPHCSPTLLRRAGHGGKSERDVLPVAKQTRVHGPCCLGWRYHQSLAGNLPGFSPPSDVLIRQMTIIIVTLKNSPCAFLKYIFLN